MKADVHIADEMTTVRLGWPGLVAQFPGKDRETAGFVPDFRIMGEEYRHLERSFVLAAQPLLHLG
jgi:hypothetical protein